MIVIEDDVIEELRAIPGTQDVVAALTLARREPDLWRMTWPTQPPSNWQPMPARKIKPSDGNPTLEYAYRA